MLHYAENIKKLRKQKKITQSELADGIASQGTISKIEKNQISPDIDLLEAIAGRLECSVLDLLMKDTKNDLNQIYIYLENLIVKREYLLLEQFFKSDSSIQKIKFENESFYRMINSIIISQNYNDYEKSIVEMLNALELSENNQFTIRILVGISGLYSEIEDFDKSLNNLLEAVELSKKTKIDSQLQQKIYYQLARVYSVLENFEDSIFYNKIAIEFAVKCDSLFLLDDLYLLLSDSYLRTDNYEEARKYVEMSKIIATIRSNNQLIPYIEKTKLQIERIK